MEGFGVHTFRLVNAAGQIDLRQVPLEAEARAAVGGLERGRQDQRRRPRLPPPRPVGRDHNRATSPNGSWACSSSTRRSPRNSRSTSSTRPSSIPEEEVPIRRVGRLVLDRCVDNFFAETEQVAFCTQNIVPGHRLHQRPAAAGAQLLLPRHAGQAARRPELHLSADQRAEVPVPHVAAGRAHGMHQPQGPRQLRAQLVGRRTAARASRPSAASGRYPAEETGPKCALAPRRSPTTTARRASSTSARPRSSRSTSRPRSPSS